MRDVMSDGKFCMSRSLGRDSRGGKSTRLRRKQEGNRKSDGFDRLQDLIQVKTLRFESVRERPRQ